MLGLLSDTDPQWVNIVEQDLSTFMSDHVYAEQKAASNGFSFVIQYPEKEQLVNFMGSYAMEESEHFKRVLDYMRTHQIPLKKDVKNLYVNHLRNFFKKSNKREENLINRLLIASLIEARSCERFAVFSKHTQNDKLAKFYHELIKDEVGHHKLFLQLAKNYQGEEVVNKKWQELLNYEAAYMRKQGKTAYVHG